MPSDFTPDRLTDRLAALPRARRWVLAFSGGLDSVVLLHALAALRRRFRARLSAVHVHHGLQSAADDWVVWCAAEARRLRAGFTLRRVRVEPRRGESIEAAARAARYAALRDCLAPGDLLFTAHHRDDQAESFLLMALRGSGSAGQAAMPALARFAPGWHARPLLGFPRAALAAWAREEGLEWLEDPSNLDSRFDRNYLRREILPRLKLRWPAADETLARAARHAAEAVELVEALAAGDWVRCVRPDGRTLAVGRVAALPPARARALLRHWLSRAGLPPPPARELERVIGEVLPAGADRQPRVRWPGAEVRRYRDGLYALPPLGVAPAASLAWSGRGSLPLPAGLGRLALVPVSGTGLVAARLEGARLEVRFRRGGEKLRPAPGARTRALKTLLQEAGVVPWMRDRLPLLYLDGKLVAVADRWLAADFLAAEGEPGLRVAWSGGPVVF